MSRQISEQGGDAALQKRIRQAVYDIRYKARKDELDLRHAYSQYIGKSGLDQTGKEAVQNKLFGKSQQAESNVLEAASSNKYKVRVSDNETGKTYIRYAKRDKISKLRSKGSVEMTGHGSPKGAKNAPSVKKDPKKKLKSAGPAPKKVALSKKKPGVVALPKKAKPVQVQVVDPKKMEKNETDVVGSAVKSLRKIVRKEAFIADATAVAPPVNKKITGEKVDNTKLIKVFPQDGSDPQIGSIKSSYKPVGEVVAEIVNPQQVDEVVGQVVGGLLGATAGKGLAAKGLAKVAGAATKAGAPAAVAKALTSKAAPKIAGAALGSKVDVLGGKKKKSKRRLKKEGYTNVVEDITDILARLEKKRISKGGNPDESPLGKKTGRAMKAQQDKVRKKAGLKTEHHQKDADGNTIPHEEINELKTSTLRSYVNRASIDAVGRGVDAGVKGMTGPKKEMEKNMTKAYKRQRGINTAANKLASRAERKENFSPESTIVRDILVKKN